MGAPVEQGRKPTWDMVLIECCRWAATAIGEGRELREPQLLQRSSIASAGEGPEQGQHGELQSHLQSWGLAARGQGWEGWQGNRAQRGLFPVELQPEGDGGREAEGNTDIMWEVIPAKCSCCSLKGSVALDT